MDAFPHLQTSLKKDEEYHIIRGLPPAVFSRMKVDAWQYEVCTELPDFKTDPWNCIRTDEALLPGKEEDHEQDGRRWSYKGKRAE